MILTCRRGAAHRPQGTSVFPIMLCPNVSQPVGPAKDTTVSELSPVPPLLT